MTIHKIVYLPGSVLKWGYWIEDEGGPLSGDKNTYWLIAQRRSTARPRTITFKIPLGSYLKRHEDKVHYVKQLDGVTLGGLFQHLHDITEEEGPA